MPRRSTGAVLLLAMSALVSPATADEQISPVVPVQQKSVGADGVERLVVDFAKTVTLPRPASTVIIGNTGIAQASLSDDRTVILTGKTPGSTNLIVIDRDGAEVANLILDVVAGSGRLVTVHQGLRRATFTCGRRCDPVLLVGDDADHFNATASQIAARNGFSAPAPNNQQ
ncbi:pilus assembly protein N-terminal domain-containing protein [Sinorhizobium medicae]|uniref:pilus assembly protein N-terminal domain-containing protein n=1 Tax=Sinorhizobium medicae TaxID=110321 RepID=UPI0003619BCA|nr:pilus assembly protein N-terminal domain-containing protein [Sinorhizobium medicae]